MTRTRSSRVSGTVPPMRVRMARLSPMALPPFAVIVLVWSASAQGGATPSSETLSGRTMGTTWTATWHGSRGNTDEVPASVVADELPRLLDRVDRMMSTWRDDSEISRFNSASSTDWFAVSHDTMRVLRRALEIAAQSDGAFDVTVSPLVALWGFGVDGQRPAPDEQQVAAAIRRVGWQKLEVRTDPPSVRKSEPEVTVDLSAIAKGYAVDLLGIYLDSIAVAGYLVEVGGETRVQGARADGSPWRIGIEQPLAGQRRVRRVLTVSGETRSIATSGDYRNRRNVGGRVLSHTIDPRTGHPVEHSLAAVTVVAEDCMTADALATTLMVLGPVDGLAHARRHGVAALLLTRTGTTINEQATEEFSALFGDVGGRWWNTWVPVLGLVVLAVCGLSAGVLLKGRGLVGSCGGLALMCDRREDPHCGACGVRGEDVAVANGDEQGVEPSHSGHAE